MISLQVDQRTPDGDSTVVWSGCWPTPGPLVGDTFELRTHAGRDVVTTWRAVARHWVAWTGEDDGRPEVSSLTVLAEPIDAGELPW